MLSSKQREWLGIAACSVGKLACVALALLVAQDAYADLGEAGTRIDSKFEDVRELAVRFAWGIIGVGGIILGVKMTKGDPDVSQKAWQYLLGALIVYLIPQLLVWLQQ